MQFKVVLRAAGLAAPLPMLAMDYYFGVTHELGWSP